MPEHADELRQWLDEFSWILDLPDRYRTLADAMADMPEGAQADWLHLTSGTASYKPKTLSTYVKHLRRWAKVGSGHEVARLLRRAREALKRLGLSETFSSLPWDYRSAKAAMEALYSTGQGGRKNPWRDELPPELTELVVSPETVVAYVSEHQLPRYEAPVLTDEIAARLIAFYSEEIDAAHEAVGSEVLEIGARRYPVVVARTPTFQALDSLLPVENVDARESAAFRGYAVRDPLPRLRKEIRKRTERKPTQDIDLVQAESASYSGWNLCATRIVREPSGTLRLEANTAQYGDIMDTCDALIDEAASSPSAPMSRRAHLRDLENPLLDARFRAAGIGMAALLCYEHTGADGRLSLRCLLGRRSFQVGTYPNTWHVAPAGMLNWRFEGFNPDGSHGRPWGSFRADDIRTSILSEYGEELFNRKDLEGHPQREAVLSAEPVVELLRRLARLEITGIAIDLGNLRPEICILIYVPSGRLDVPDAQGFESLSFESNDEYQPPFEGLIDHFVPATLSTEDADLSWPLNLLAPDRTVPSGAASFALGSERARAIFRERLRDASRQPG